MENKSRFIFAVIAIGFASVTTQVMLTREFLVVFYGNELSLGIILANWLFLVAIGSLAFGRFADRIERKMEALAVSQILLSVLILLSVFFVRSVRALLGTAVVEVVDIPQMLYSSFIILTPVCIVIGFQFALACRISLSGNKTARKIGWVYVYESLGSAAGGFAFSFFLVHLSSVDAAIFAGMLVLFSAFLISINKKMRSAVILLLFLLFFVAISFSGTLDGISVRSRWGWFDLVESRDSVYGNVAVTRIGEQYNFYENGLFIFATDSLEFNEELVHFTMLEHPSPRNILLIGGGLSGALKEIHKHHPGNITYIELDPLAIETAEKYVSNDTKKSLDDVEVKNVDGRLFLKQTVQKYDVILVSLAGPSNAQLNRFYTIEFFGEAKKALSEGGLLSVSLSSSESYVGKEMRELNGGIYKTLGEIFKNVIAISGDYTLVLIASDANLTYDSKTLTERLKDRKIENSHADVHYISQRLSEDKINTTLASLEGGVVNTDFRPVAYYHGMLLWSARVSPTLENIFIGISSMWWEFFIAILFAVTAILVALRGKTGGAYVPIAIATTGFAGIFFEIVLLLAFQVLYGYVYYMLSVLITSFMVGLVLGSAMVNFYMDKTKKSYVFIMLIQFAIALYSLSLPSLIAFSSFENAVIVFPFLAIISGFLVGAEFPIANKIYIRNFETAGKTAGTLYGADLLGACIGALTASILLVPLLGIANVCYAVALLNIMPLALLISSQIRSH
jgi:spermidine synthase